MELVDEIAQLWIQETGLNPPYRSTLQTWLESTARISDVFTAIRITGRRVRATAGTEMEFNLSTAAACCRNSVRRIRQERIAREYRKGVTQ